MKEQSKGQGALKSSTTPRPKKPSKAKSKTSSGVQTPKLKGHKPTKQEALTKAYKKERKRVTQAARRLRKQGYDIKDIPKIPKRITTASIRKLQKITPETLRKAKTTTYKHMKTGKVMTGEEGRKLEKKMTKSDKYLQNLLRQRELERMKISAQLNLVNKILSQFNATLYGIYEPAYQLIMRTIKEIEQRVGQEELAKMLEEAMQNGIGITREDSYSRGRVLQYLDQLLSYLDVGQLTRDEINETIEEYEEWNMLRTDQRYRKGHRGAFYGED